MVKFNKDMGDPALEKLVARDVRDGVKQVLAASPPCSSMESPEESQHARHSGNDRG